VRKRASELSEEERRKWLEAVDKAREGAADRLGWWIVLGVLAAPFMLKACGVK